MLRRKRRRKGIKLQIKDARISKDADHAIANEDTNVSEELEPTKLDYNILVSSNWFGLLNEKTGRLR